MLIAASLHQANQYPQPLSVLTAMPIQTNDHFSSMTRAPKKMHCQANEYPPYANECDRRLFSNHHRWDAMPS